MRNAQQHDSRTQDSRQSGFTMIEVLVSLAIFSIAVTGVIAASVRGDINVNKARNALTASALADEGLELMRAMRDSTVLARPGVGWAYFTSTIPGLSGYCTSAVPCDIDASNRAGLSPYPQITNFAPCATVIPGTSTAAGAPAAFCPLYYVPSGYYDDQATPGLSPTIFSRALVVEPGSTADELKVTSTVVWYEGTLVRETSKTESMYNWY